MNSPYSDLPSRSFWRSAVTDRAPTDPGDLYEPKFKINNRAKIVTAGSCFAQHVGRTLAMAGFNVMDAEPPPKGFSDRAAQSFGYKLYSARYSNIYTVRQLLQILDEAEGKFQPAIPVWEKGGRYFDAMRPNVEPEGLESAELVMEHRKLHLEKVLSVFNAAEVFVFTFGLTEAWIHKETGTVYPTAPGTIAGNFDSTIFSFKNYRFAEILGDFQNFRARMVNINPNMRFVITTSPVPLTATASGQHVEVASCYSKSVLRAVCGTLTEIFKNVDYFPSYEIITSINNRGIYFENNKRSVSSAEVDTAMALFMKKHGAPAPLADAGSQGKAVNKSREVEETGWSPDAICEEALLDAFRK